MERWKEIIETSSSSELFRYRKKDFGGIIHETLEKQRLDMKENMKRFTYFRKWSNELIDECTHLSKLKYFEPNQIIYGKGFGQTSYVYFILNGKCYIIEDITYLVKYDSLGNKKYTLQKEDEPKEKIRTDPKKSCKKEKRQVKLRINPERTVFSGRRPKSHVVDKRVVRKLLQIYTLNETACFGLGELDNNRFIISSSSVTVKCLLIPRYWLLAHNDSNIWCRILQFFKHRLPTTEGIFKEYVNEKKWSKSKREFTDSLMRKTSVKRPAVEAIPYSIRIMCDCVSD